MVFIVNINNDLSYDDFDHWVGGVFSTFEKAKEFGIANSAWFFNIDEWNIDGELVKNHYIEKNSIGEWR